MAFVELPHPDTIRQRLTYDPETGLFFSKRTLGLQIFRGINRDGYHYGSCDNRTFLAHRLAWTVTHGAWPIGKIDHINGNRRDNRLCNLRVVSDRENAMNRAVRFDNISGRIGVSWSKRDKCWKASIRIDGKPVYLGNFRNLEDAIAARSLAESGAGYHPNHGRPATPAIP